MSSIDNRIVRMGFENGQFTNAANATMGTLKKLSESLKLAEGARGLENLAAKAKSVDMSVLADGVETISSRFSVMDIVGVTALVNIANQAINTGKQLIHSLTIQPIKMGFDEYELKMGSIQTIMASTGESVEVVNGYLNELNEYSDKTIYSFSDMTQNIGKFTNAGVKLEDAVLAIKGISNEAAVSGANANEASRAMYNFAQALSAGSVKLIDWKSIENANMATVEFKEALMATALELGTIVQVGDEYVTTTTDLAGKTSEAFTATKGFNETLSNQWMTTEVLVETLKQYADETTELGSKAFAAAKDVKTLSQVIDVAQETVQSGWAGTFELMFGNIEEAKLLWTGVSEVINGVINAQSDYRNNNLEIWKDMGGRTSMIKALGNIFKSISSIIKPIADAFQRIFDPWNGERLYNMTTAFEKFTEKLIPGEDAASAIGRAFEGLFSIIKVLLSPLKLVTKVFEWIVIIGKPIIEAISKIAGALGGVATKGTEALESSTLFTKALDWITKRAEDIAWILEKVFDDLEWVFKWAYEKGSVYVDKFGTKFSELVGIGKEKIRQGAEYVAEWIEVHKPIEKAGEYVKIALETIQTAITNFVDFCKSAITNIRGFFDSVVQKVKDSDIQAIDLVNVGLFATAIIGIKKFLGFAKKFFGGFDNVKDGVLGVLDELKNTMEAYQKDIKADMLKKVAISIAILTGALFVLAKIDPDRLIPASVAMVSALTALLVTMKLLEKIKDKSLKESMGTMALMVGIGVSLYLIGKTMARLSELNFPEIVNAIVGLSAAVLAMMGLLVMVDGLKIPKKLGSTLMKMALSINLLVLSIKMLSTMDTNEMMDGIMSLAAVMGVLAIFLRTLDKLELGNFGKGLIPLALSMIVFAGAIALFGRMDIGTLQQGGAALTAALVILSLFLNTLRGFNGNVTSIGFGILLLADALLVLSAAVAIFGNMKLSTLAVGIGAIGIVMGIFAQNIRRMPKNTAAIGAGLLLLSLGIGALVVPIALLGMMKLSTIMKGLLGLAGILGILAVSASIFSTASLPMMMFAGAIALLGAASFIAGKGLIVLAAGFATFSGSLVLIGGSFMALLAMLAVAIPVLAASLALAIVSFVTVIGSNAKALGRAFTAMMKEVLNTVIESIPLAVEAITLFISEILNSVTELAPVIAETLMTLMASLKDVVISFVNTILQAIMELGPVIMQTIITVILLGLKAIDTLVPAIVSTVMNVITSILDTLAENLPKIADSVLRFITDLILTVLDNIADAIPKIASSIVDIITAIVKSIGDGIPRVVDAIFDLVVSIINGLANSVSTKMPEVRQAIRNLIDAILTEFANCIGDMVSVGGDIISGLIRGISNGVAAVKDAAMNVARSALNAAKDFLGIHSPSREFGEVGKWSSLGMANGLTEYGCVVEDEATAVGEKALDGMRSAMADISDVIDTDLDSQPVIRPVLDLSEIQNGARGIDGALSGGYSIRASADSVRNAATMMSNSKLSKLSNLGDTTNTTTTNSITNHFTINGSNPKEIASEVSRILQKQVERRDVVWG